MLASNNHQIMENSELSSLFFYAKKIISIVFMGALLSACEPRQQSQLVSFSGPIMGTDYLIKVNLPIRQATSKSELDKLEQGVLQQMDLVNTQMSTYLSKSEVSQFNRLSADVGFKISEPVRQVIEESLKIANLSHGAFDITIAKAVNLWGFGADGKVNRTPSEQQLELLKQSIGFQKLHLNGAVLSKSHNNTSIDLSAIAKGFAVDLVADYLDAQQQQNFLINIGGELRASGVNADGKIWRVAIEKPQTLGGVQQIIDLNNASIATSGDYRNYIVIDDKQYSHTIDPTSLQPVSHRLASVSVVSDRASTADALATAISVMGEQRGFDFANEHSLAVYMVIRGERQGDYEVKITDKFATILR